MDGPDSTRNETNSPPRKQRQFSSRERADYFMWRTTHDDTEFDATTGTARPGVEATMAPDPSP